MYHGYDGILLNQVKSSILCLMLNFRCYRKEKKVDPFTPFFCFSLEQGVIFRAWALKRVSIFAFFILKQGQGLRTFMAHPYPKIMGALPPRGGGGHAKVAPRVAPYSTSCSLFQAFAQPESSAEKRRESLSLLFLLAVFLAAFLFIN